MDAVGAVHIHVPGRPEHHGIARCLPAIAVCRGVGMVIRLELYDRSPDTIDKKCCTDQVRRHFVDAAGEEILCQPSGLQRFFIGAQRMLHLGHIFTTFTNEAFAAPFPPQGSTSSIYAQSNADWVRISKDYAGSWTPRPTLTLRAGCPVGM